MATWNSTAPISLSRSRKAAMRWAANCPQWRPYPEPNGGIGFADRVLLSGLAQRRATSVDPAISDNLAISDGSLGSIE